MSNKRITSIILCFFITTLVFAQQDSIDNNEKLEKRLESLEKLTNKLRKVTISGHFQGQYIVAQPDAVLRIGAPNTNPNENFSRLGIRQGRIRTMFEDGVASAVMQIDLSERGVIIIDALTTIRDPWIKTNFFRGGLFFRPFGHEVRYPTGRRETPERTRIINTIFPGARDVGGMIHLQTDKKSPLHIFELEGALVAGNAINSETDNKRDFLGYFGVTPEINKDFDLHVGTSYYRGSVFQGSEVVFRTEGNGFVRDENPDNLGRFARREYFGFDIQSTYRTVYGRSQIRAEYIFGKQPGSAINSVSPNWSRLPVTDTYLRNFSGGYVTFVQDLGKLPFTAYTRFDWYDPNTKVAGNEVGLNYTTSADIFFNTIGFGAMWKITKDMEINGYYEFTKNETTVNLANFVKDRRDNIFTMTLMFRY